MTSETFARVVFQSPLPALDREFEYAIPNELVSSIQLGCRVKVPFAGQRKEGFVVGLSSEAEFKGKLSSISELVSSLPVLKPHVYQTLKAVASRQACSVGELLDNAVPKRSVRVEENFIYSSREDDSPPDDIRRAELVRPVVDSLTGLPRFMSRLVELATSYYLKGRSVIVCVPDFRDLEGLSQLLRSAIGPDGLVIMDSSDVGSKRYVAFMEQLQPGPRVVLGNRSAIYSPISGSAAIIIWDDGDQSHQDQQSPYLNTREIALIRQSLFLGPLHFLSHARSTDLQRLVQIGYVTESPIDSWRPKVSISEGRGLDGSAFKVIKQGLETGPVLFQVAAPGKARSLYCHGCNVRSRCAKCHGPLWLNASGKIVCRWCGQFNLDFRCQDCGGEKLSQGAAGTTRWVEQLGKSFPGIPIREVTAQSSSVDVSNKPQIVVSTPGVEPVAKNGYAAVVLVDCAAQLARDSLRAPEDALRGWLNALAFMSQSGSAVAVGPSIEVSKALSLGEVIETASNMLAERDELGFPPARRMLSAVGSLDLLTKLGDFLKEIDGVQILGVASAQAPTAEPDHRLIAAFTYGSGNQVALAAKEFLARLSSKEVRTSSKSGRSIRPITIKFDDPRVL